MAVTGQTILPIITLMTPHRKKKMVFPVLRSKFAAIGAFAATNSNLPHDAMGPIGQYTAGSAIFRQGTHLTVLRFLEQMIMQSFEDLPIQDEDKTASLVQALGEARYLDLISLVPPEVEKILERYKAPAGQNDGSPEVSGPDRRRDAHTLKGLAGNYGLARLEHTARALEADSLTDAELDQLLDRLQICVDEIMTIGNR